MSHKILQLTNGIKLVHQQTDSPVSHFGILINAGTRDEDENKSGIAHFVEHTIFKGTTHRKNYQILRRMEDVGGDLNASTSKEETWFHSSFLSSDYKRAVELLSDILFYPIFPEKELEKEKDVVYEEIKYYKDTLSELIFDDFEAQIFKNHPLGRSILGTKASVKKISRKDIYEFVKQQYTLSNVMLSSVGNISVDRLYKLCDRHFGTNKMVDFERDRTSFSNYIPQKALIHKNSSQTHLMVGIPAYSIYDPKRIPFLLLTNLLGGQGLNTRLNMVLREKMGLVYTVESSYSQFTDSGIFSIYAGCDNGLSNKCIDLIYKELIKLKNEKLGTLQLHFAKKQYIGQMALSNESKLNEMLANGRQGLFFDTIETFEEAIAIIESITADALLEVANEIYDIEQFSTLVYTK
ncbi:MAG: insulinase family protein [Bacteroidales bacterium]|nr:insulinase family protein [Bacteroidales bacterium]